MMRAFCFRTCVSMRCGTHTCLIGEKSSRYTKTDCFADGDTSTSAHYRFRIKRALDDHHKCRRHVIDMKSNQNQASYNVNACHNWHNLLYHSCQTFGSTNENESCQYCQHKTDRDRRNIDSIYLKYLCKRNTDRVGLYHIAHKPKC